jgi:hypothetical protein
MQRLRNGLVCLSLLGLVILACNFTRVLTPQGDLALDVLDATAEHRQLMATLWADASQTAWAPLSPNATLDAQWAGTSVPLLAGGTPGKLDPADCSCAGLPIKSASSQPDYLSCYYTWTVQEDTTTYHQKIDSTLTRIEDPRELASRFALQTQLVTEGGGALTWEGNTAVFHTERNETGYSLSKYPYLYYGTLRAMLSSRFLLSVNLRGNDYAGEAQVLGILRSLKACMEEAIEE